LYFGQVILKMKKREMEFSTPRMTYFQGSRMDLAFARNVTEKIEVKGLRRKKETTQKMGEVQPNEEVSKRGVMVWKNAFSNALET